MLQEQHRNNKIVHIALFLTLFNVRYDLVKLDKCQLTLSEEFNDSWNSNDSLSLILIVISIGLVFEIDLPITST